MSTTEGPKKTKYPKQLPSTEPDKSSVNIAINSDGSIVFGVDEILTVTFSGPDLHL